MNGAFKGTEEKRRTTNLKDPRLLQERQQGNAEEALHHRRVHKRPNILFLLSDDHSAEAVGFRGTRARLGAHAGTAHIDSLAAQGAFVEDVFVALSLCSPSRATILTGLHAHAHGVTELSGAMRTTVNGGRTYVDELVARGYRSALVGKWHLENRPSSFQQFKAFVKQGSYRNPYVVTEADEWTQAASSRVPRAEGHCSHVVASTAVAYLSDWAGSGVGTQAKRAVGRPWANTTATASTGGGGGGGTEKLTRPLAWEEEEEEEDDDGEEERPPFVLHVHFKETHEPWNFPELYENALDSVWAKQKLKLQKRPEEEEEGGGAEEEVTTRGSPPLAAAAAAAAAPRAGGAPPGIGGSAEPPPPPSWDFPEPATLMDPPLRAAGPLGGLPLGWPLEDLGERIVELQERGPQFVFGSSKLDAEKFRALLEQGDGRGARSLVHAKLVADYLRAGKAMDDAIGQVLAALGAHGFAKDTLVVYTSDQGYFLGEHNAFDKRFMWEESIRVPCAIRYPREILPGTVVGPGKLVSNVDWAPTLLDFAHVPVAHRRHPLVVANPKQTLANQGRGFRRGGAVDGGGGGGGGGKLFSSFVPCVLQHPSPAEWADSSWPSLSSSSSPSSSLTRTSCGSSYHGRSFRPLLVSGSSSLTRSARERKKRGRIHGRRGRRRGLSETVETLYTNKDEGGSASSWEGDAKADDGGESGGAEGVEVDVEEGLEEPWQGRDSIYYRYYGDSKKPRMRPGHLGLRTATGLKLVLYVDLRCEHERWQQGLTAASLKADLPPPPPPPPPPSSSSWTTTAYPKTATATAGSVEALSGTSGSHGARGGSRAAAEAVQALEALEALEGKSTTGRPITSGRPAKRAGGGRGGGGGGSGGGSGAENGTGEPVVEEGPWELFDVWADPLEAVNLFPLLRRTNATLVAALQRLLNVEALREGFEHAQLPLPKSMLKQTASSPQRGGTARKSPAAATEENNNEKQRSRRGNDNPGYGSSSGDDDDAASVKHVRRRRSLLKVQKSHLGLPQRCSGLPFDSQSFLACLREGCEK